MKSMAQAQNEPFNFKVVFGFTDSTFFNGGTDTKVHDIQSCKDKLGVIVELKTVKDHQELNTLDQDTFILQVFSIL
jgi:hypothetical protein